MNKIITYELVDWMIGKSISKNLKPIAIYSMNSRRYRKTCCIEKWMSANDFTLCFYVLWTRRVKTDYRQFSINVKTCVKT